MPAKKSARKPDFERSLKELEAVVAKLEEGDLPLEQAVKEWERGMKLRKSCDKILKNAEQKVEILLGRDADDEPEPFERDE